MPSPFTPLRNRLCRWTLPASVVGGDCLVFLRQIRGSRQLRRPSNLRLPRPVRPHSNMVGLELETHALLEPQRLDKMRWQLQPADPVQQRKLLFENDMARDVAPPADLGCRATIANRY